ncbi:MAG: DUF6094 domain-containing protein, partial [Chloroflexota bacterium]
MPPSKQKLGYYPFPQEHTDFVLQLLKPRSAPARMLDPFAGKGEFLLTAARHWNLTPYANELDKDRAHVIIDQLGNPYAIQGDAAHIHASLNSFSVCWFNPPYDIDSTAATGKRVELAMTKAAWKFLMPGGVGLWAVYLHHVTEAAITWFGNNATELDLFTLPGKHLDHYQQIILVARKGKPSPERRAELKASLKAQKANPRPITDITEARYHIPPTDDTERFYFRQREITPNYATHIAEEYGPWRNPTLQRLITVGDINRLGTNAKSSAVVPPRPGHTAVVLAAGKLNGHVLDTEEWGETAVRSKTHYHNVLVKSTDQDNPDGSTRTKQTYRRTPSTHMHLLTREGHTVEIAGDDALLQFIRAHGTAILKFLDKHFEPLYQFDMHSPQIHQYLNDVRLNGRYRLYTPQKHVAAAITTGFEKHKGILLVGQMGSGKTVMGATAAVSHHIIRTQKSPKAHHHDITTIVCPPHLVDKWQREMRSVAPEGTLIKHVRRHEDVKAFIEEANGLPEEIMKVMIIKREATKLGSRSQPAVVWRNITTAHWGPNEEVPRGEKAANRLSTQAVPHCPSCASPIYKDDDNKEPQTAKYFMPGKEGGRRTCTICGTPLWQEGRDASSSLNPHEGKKYKNTKYRLDLYIKRRYRDRIGLLIWDEIHEAQSASRGVGEAFGRLAGCAEHILAMTGTPFNGKASSLNNIEYHINPRVRQNYPWGGAPRYERKTRGSKSRYRHREGQDIRSESIQRWIDDMGILEFDVITFKNFSRVTGALTGTSTKEKKPKEAPGCSAMLVAEVLDHCVFFSLEDLGKALPEYRETIVPITMDEDIHARHTEIEQELDRYNDSIRSDGDFTFYRAMHQWGLDWTTSLTQPYTVTHRPKGLPKTSEPDVVLDIPASDSNRVYAKEQVIIDDIAEQLAKGRP